MKFNLMEILESYAAKLNPSPDRKKLAEQRLQICYSCEFITGDSDATKRCKECGCFVAGKVFSPHEDPCPKGKWNEIDAKYFNTHATKQVKNSRKLI